MSVIPAASRTALQVFVELARDGTAALGLTEVPEGASSGLLPYPLLAASALVVSASLATVLHRRVRATVAAQLSTLPGPLAAFDRTGALLALTSQAAELLGIAAASLPARASAFVREPTERLLESLERAWNGDQVHEVDLELRRGDGSPLRVRASLSLQRDRRQRPLFVAAHLQRLHPPEQHAPAPTREPGAADAAGVPPLAQVPPTEGATLDLSEREWLRLSQLALERSSTPVLWVEPNGRFVFANPEAARLLGYSREELLRLGVRDVDARSDDFWPTAWHRLQAEGFVTVEVQFRRKDGSAFPVELSANYIRFEGREFNFAFVRDLTESKRAEAALRDREEKYRLLVENQTDLVVKVDPEGRFLFASPSYCATFGKTEDELIGRRFMPMVHEEDRAPTEEAMKQLAAPPYSCYIEQRAMTTRGWRWLAWVDTAVLDERQQVVAIIGVGRDITQRKLAEQAVRESELRFRTLAEAVPAIVWTATPDGGIDYVNELMRAYSTSAEGSGWQAAVLQQDLPVTLAAWDEARRDGRPMQVQHRVQRRDGEIRWHLTRAIPFRDSEGRVVKWFGTSVDIHDQKIAEETLHRQAAALEDATRRKDEFIAMLAHELRNPLAPIRTAIQLMQMRASDDPDSQRFRDVIGRQVAHMSRLLDDLLDVSRITRGKITLKQDRLDLRRVIEQAVELSGAPAAGRRIALSARLPSEPLWVEGDATRLEQVMRNLLTNSVKYTEPGGSIHVEARFESEGPAPGAKHGWAVVLVRDTGIGIPAHILPRIFEPFVQAEQALDRAAGGLGIGLTLVRQLVELHGGSAEARSEGPGRGSEFVVRVPLLEPMALPERSRPVEAARRPGFAGGAGGPPVLVVDDNLDAVELLAELMRICGYSVETAEDGPRAVEAALKHRPKVVLLDIGLPGMDGFEVARRLRGEEATRDALLIAITGYGQADARQRATDSGFDLHLTKPFDPDELLELVRQALAAPDGPRAAGARAGR